MSPKAVILVAAVALGALLSCQKQDERIPVLTVPESTVIHSGGTQMITVGADYSWNLAIDYAGSQQGWIEASSTSGNGTQNVRLTVQPNESEDPRSATLRLTTPMYSVSSQIIQSGNFILSMPQWLELPALDHPEMFFGVHSMDGGKYQGKDKSGTRNWSFYYDYDAFVSWWVAYPLNKGLIGSGSRTDHWQATDPLLGKDEVYDVTYTYGGGWTRGHQIPSADRLNYKPNVSTFYPTNMTPQDYDFNTEIWADLEMEVRSYALNCDTLYVTTGADVRNSTQKTGTNTGKIAMVKVPTHYYKALLRKSGNDYSAVGFYFPHNSEIANDDFNNYTISIAELEKKVGVEFFVVLPYIIGKEKVAAIKKANPKKTLENW